MNKIQASFVIISALAAQTAQARTVEVEVHGMTCAFCVDSLERKFRKTPGVSDVSISLKNKRIRLETAADRPSLEEIKKAILDTGFTPMKVEVSK